MISQIEKYDPTLSIQHVYLFSLYSKNGNSTTVTFQRISQFDTIPPNFI